MLTVRSLINFFVSIGDLSKLFFYFYWNIPNPTLTIVGKLKLCQRDYKYPFDIF